MRLKAAAVLHNPDTPPRRSCRTQAERAADSTGDGLALARAGQDGVALAGDGRLAPPVANHCLGKQLVVWHRLLLDVGTTARIADRPVDELS